MNLDKLITLLQKRGFGFVCAILVIYFAYSSYVDNQSTIKMLSSYLEKSITTETYIGYKLDSIDKLLDKLELKLEENNRDIREVKTKMEFIDRIK